MERIKSLTNLRKTVTSRSLKEIYKMNLFLIGLAFFFSIFFTLLFDKPLLIIVSVAFKSSFYIFLVTFLLTYILKFCAFKFPYNLGNFRLWRFVLSFISVNIIQLILWVINSYFGGYGWKDGNEKLFLIFITQVFILVNFILLLQDFVILGFAKNQTELDNSKLQIRNAEAENLLLKQQIQPHFLFNSLSTLKAIYKKDILLGEAYLLRLADFLRLTVSHHKKLVTTLKEELLLCENYLEMQKIRFGEALDWNLKIHDNLILEWYLPFFSLQPLLENAIKHNSFTKEQPLKILIEQEGENIIVSNVISSNGCQETSIKSGLVNLAERYQLWSGDEIIIKNNGILFSVSFKLYQNENSNNRR